MTDFERQMREYLPTLKSALANDIGDWVVKGFIDTYQNILYDFCGYQSDLKAYRAYVVSLNF